MRGALTLIILALMAASVISDQSEEIPHHEVKNWALKFGVDLWEFGKHFTKMNQIQNKYHEYGVEVKRRDGLLLLRELVAEVRNFMDFKLNSVMRLLDSAEQAGAGSGAADAARRSGYYDSRWINVHSDDGSLSERARTLLLTPSRHFDHLAVNTTYSAVLVPPGTNLEDSDILREIKWSEHLDPIFVNNFETDRSLSWQYYASANGFLRRYPAISWPPEDGLSHHARDLYEFRSSPWFVEAASSPKDIIILLEEGAGTLGAHSANAVLEVLGPNDFVNVFTYGDTLTSIVPCYENMLAQANTGTIRELRQAVWTAQSKQSSGSSVNLTAAFASSFQLLQHYNRSGKGCQCNQAIIVIGSGEGISGARRVFRSLNWPHKPVRVFSLAVDADASGAEALHEAACSNKGYYSYISSSDEVRRAVLNIIRTMARPMVLYQSDHPARFSPVYIGGRSASLADDGFGQPMMSLTMPVFDRRNHTEREANLLGVVGTDIPIEEIKKLLPPHKLGVNGYSFVVDNNGHVVFHPDLRPVHTNEEYTETLRPTYVNVDLTEVELLAESDESRINYTALLNELRRQMIDQHEGETELLVQTQIERQKRVAIRRQRYYYAPLPKTPFSLAIALPDNYGQYHFDAQQEIKWTNNLTEYFKGTNWRVHPDWVYCDYDSDVLKFSSAEERLLHFLSRLNKPAWKWMSVRPRATHATHQKQEKDSYFCDKTLVQSLVRDAMVIKEVDSHTGIHSHHNHQGYEKFGVVWSFIATRSGFIKWSDNNGTRKMESPEHELKERYSRAIDSDWYKRAVDHHSIEPESFVFAVEKNEGATVISAAHALFVENKHRAPAAVLGIHFNLNALSKHFTNITSACTAGNSCKKTCGGDELDCYILDDSGFIILSEDESKTGKFFGEIDGTFMDSLVEDKIYKRLDVYDNQGKCADGDNPFVARGHILKPRLFRYITALLKHIVATWVTIFHVQPINAWPHEDLESYVEPDYEDDIDDPPVRGDYEIMVEGSNVDVPPTQSPSAPAQGPAVSPPSPAPAGLRACKTRTHLYALQHTRLNKTHPLKGKFTNCHNSGCERPFSVQKVPHSNLILLVIDTLCPCGQKTLQIQPKELIKGCQREMPYRKTPAPCINYHPEEIEIQSCGGASLLQISSFVISLAVVVIKFTV